jgi:hypothetical protein
MVTLVTSPYLPDAIDHVQRDLIESERDQRRTAEGLARELAKVLHDLAISFDGERLESLRREDPKIPQYWTPDDWHKFFANVPSPSNLKNWGEASRQQENELQSTIAEVGQRLVKAEKRPGNTSLHTDTHPFNDKNIQKRPEVRSKEPARKIVTTPRSLPVPAAFEVPAEMTPPLGSLLEKAREIWNLVPAVCPASFRNILSGLGRTGVDLQKAYKRYWLVLYLIGTFRLNPVLEIEDLLAMSGGLSSRAGSIGRILDELLEADILSARIVQLSAPRTCLKLVWLAPQGISLFKILFDHEPQESDWERQEKCCQGKQSPDCALAVQIFAMHARKRGWASWISAKTDSSRSTPDVLVLKGSEKWSVRVETGQEPTPLAFHEQVGVNSGPAAFCATTPITRERLIASSRLEGMSGFATDIETLVLAKYPQINEQTPLWAESW